MYLLLAMEKKREIRRLPDVPEYLMPYVANQDPSLYTYIDHAAWRYILKISQAFFKDHAHEMYLQGLKKTGISTERIPLISEMNDCLSQFGWGAVPVVGFIPPAVFMEFLSLGILPIACDMRTLEHLPYTPAPDIVHEAAGHAPIVADPEYAEYLKQYGEVSRKAIFSDQDMNVYQAIRLLSDTKENPQATQKEIDAAQNSLDQAIQEVTFVSEATLLSRMGWWTFEYGLIGSLNAPKIYGAGLLSSVSESYHCLHPKIKKIPFSISCIDVSYDITRPQPQLFVSPDFQTLKQGLNELANQMAFRRGGIEGLDKAVQAQTVTTTQLDTGIQVSGILSSYLKNERGEPFYLKFQGPTQIAFQDQEILGQGADYHREGFGTPLEDLGPEDFKKVGWELGKTGSITLRSGVHIEGKWTRCHQENGRFVLLTFENCKAKWKDQVLFQPEWGNYDIVCGKKVVSVFGGAADRKRFLQVTGGFHQDPSFPKTNLTKENQELNKLYRKVRTLREQQTQNVQDIKSELKSVYTQLREKYPKDWLLLFEILELDKARSLGLEFTKELESTLDHRVRTDEPLLAETIGRGLNLLKILAS